MNKYFWFLFLLPFRVGAEELPSYCHKDIYNLRHKDESGYQERSNQRCEGLYEASLSSGAVPIVELVGFRSASLKGMLSSGDTASIYQPIRNIDAVFMKFESAPQSGQSYRMDALSTKSPFVWPLYLVSSLSLSNTELTFLAWHRDKIRGLTENIHLPITLSADGDVPLALDIQLVRPLSSLTLSFFEVSGDGTVADEATEVINISNFPKIEPALIEIRLQKWPIKETGLFQLTMDYRLVNQDSRHPNGQRKRFLKVPKVR